MMEPSYKRIKSEGSAETVVKKSRFIAYASVVFDELSAKDFIDLIKERHKDASHNTYAYIVGKATKTERYSDDGEPGGTAGIPILNKIQQYGLTDTIVVVTRYFGGTLLGTGGLARAYSGSAEEVIHKCGTAGFIEGYLVSVEIEYHFHGKVSNYIRNRAFGVIDEIFTDRVIIKTLIPVDEYSRTVDDINELTGAASKVELISKQFIEMES